MPAAQSIHRKKGGHSKTPNVSDPIIPTVVEAPFRAISVIGNLLLAVGIGLGIAGFVISLITIIKLGGKVSSQNECTVNSDCGDSNPCTIDICQSDGSCTFVAISDCNPFSIPFQTLYVSPEWIPMKSNSTYYFTTISDAITAAASYTNRTATDPVNIIIYTGLYTENVTLIPNIALTGQVPQYQVRDPTVQINGLTFGYTALDEDSTLLTQFTLSNLIIDSDVTFDFFPKINSNPQTTVNIFNTDILGTFVYSGRGSSMLSSKDELFLHEVQFGSTVTLTSTDLITGDTITFQDALITNTTSHTVFSNSAVNGGLEQHGGSFLQFYSSAFNAETISLADSATLIAYNCYFDSGSLTVASGATADLRMSEVDPSFTLSGAGSVARSIYISQNVASSSGINTFNISPPYPSTAYNVLWTQVGGVNNQAIKITSKTASAFQWNDTVGGDHYDFTLMMQ